MSLDSYLRDFVSQFDVHLETIGAARLAGWAFPPQDHDLPPALWLLAIPGMTYTATSYYDRQVPGHAPHTYSVARHVAAQGIGSLLLDNLGTGESPFPESGKLTSAIFAEAYHKVAQQVRQRLHEGDLIPGLSHIPLESCWLAGMGHSMGARLLTHTQGRYHPFDAVILLGYQNNPHARQARLAAFGTEATVKEFSQRLLLEASQPAGVPKARAFLRPQLYSPNVSELFIQTDEQEATVVPARLVDELSAFRGTGEWARLITEPVYLGFGEHEIPPTFREEPSAYGSSSITLIILKDAAHCAFFEPNRHEMFDDIAAWCRTKAVQAHKRWRPYHPVVTP